MRRSASSAPKTWLDAQRLPLIQESAELDAEQRAIMVQLLPLIERGAAIRARQREIVDELLAIDDHWREGHALRRAK